MKDLSPSDIIDWFRSKSREYARTAARMEKDFGLKPSDLSLGGEDEEQAPIDPIITYLREIGAKRPADIADHIKSTKEAVLATVRANSDVFEVAARGWIKLKGGTTP